MKLTNLILLAFTLFSTSLIAQTHSAKIVFYNVENLFDTLDDPHKNDNEFLPNSSKKWNAKKYEQKLRNLSAVLGSIDTVQLPALIGLCEVENKKVTVDLSQSKGLNAGAYKVIHHDSPDSRGIDVAAMYRPDIFKLTTYSYHPITLPGSKKPATREILVISGSLAKNPVFVIFSHWPSRAGGQDKSDPKRAAVAVKIRTLCDSLNKAAPNTPIVCMGDFNDTPSDYSVYQSLGADTLVEPTSKNLINLMALNQQEGDGSYWYQNHWEALDNIVVSKGLVFGNGKLMATKKAHIHRADFYMHKISKGRKIPSRTYSAGKYTGGYSDHLPVYLELIY